MAMKLKPIDTLYNGYRFRSRLEARWAVFFDALGIEYEYEKEGYDLGEAGWYLPDFWLPHHNLWAEVKPTPLSDQEFGKCCALTTETDHNCLLLVGTPADKPYDEMFPDRRGEYKRFHKKSPNEDFYGLNMLYTKYGWCGTYSVFLRWIHFEGQVIFLASQGTLGEDYSDRKATQNAVISARSARFEFGDACQNIS